MTLRSRTILAATAVVATATLAIAAGEILWNIDFDGSTSISRISATKKYVAAQAGTGRVYIRNAKTGEAVGDIEAFSDVLMTNGLVLTAGVGFGTGSDTFGVVVAYSPKDLSPDNYVWAYDFGRNDGGGQHFERIVGDGKIVIAAGHTEGDTNWNFEIIALDAKTGDFLWRFSGPMGAFLSDVSIKGRMVAVTSYTTALHASIFLLDAGTGTALLAEAYTAAEGSFFDHVQATKKGAVVAGIVVEYDDDDLFTGALTAYYEPSGMRWDDVQMAEQSDASSGDVEVSGKLAITAGRYEEVNGVSPSEGFVRAFDLETGDQVWEVIRDNGTYNDVQGLAVKGKTIAACGYYEFVGGAAADVFGIDAESGDAIWTVTGIEPEADGLCQHIQTAGKSIFFASSEFEAQLIAATTK